jgi:hypothetical protein
MEGITAPLVKIQAATAAEICAHFYLQSNAKKILRGGTNPQEFLALLIEKRQYLPAIDFLAHALPAREGIWWGCLCMQHALGDDLPPLDRAAATATTRWVIEPSEENRAAASAPAEAAGMPSIAGWLARAVAQTGGNMAPPGVPFFKAPEPFAPAKGVATAVKFSLAKAEPRLLEKMQNAYLELGIQIAEGKFI